MHEIQSIARKFNLSAQLICARELTGGTVHKSYLVDLADGSSVVFQKINTRVFKDPNTIMHNASKVSAFLTKHSEPDSNRFLRYVEANKGGLIFADEGLGTWRAYHYIDRAHTPIPDESSDHESAELAKALGLFYRQLADFPISSLEFSIPDYHNTPKYFDRFKSIVENSSKALVDTARSETSYVLKQQKYTTALLNMNLPARVTHSEARLRNLLLDNETGRAVCLIDYDTIMPGLMAFDFGNAVRSSCRACKCDERQMNRVRFDIDRFAEFTRLFVDIVRPIFNKNEPASLAGGAIVMALEMGIRYLSDYLTGNHIFKATYPEQNLYKARVQLMLCMQMQYYYKEMENIVRRYL